MGDGEVMKSGVYHIESCGDKVGAEAKKPEGGEQGWKRDSVAQGAN